MRNSYWRVNRRRPGRLTIPATPILPDVPDPMVNGLHPREGWDFIPDGPNDPFENLEIAGSGGAPTPVSGSAWRLGQPAKPQNSSLLTPHPPPQPDHGPGNKPQYTSPFPTYAFRLLHLA